VNPEKTAAVKKPNIGKDNPQKKKHEIRCRKGERRKINFGLILAGRTILTKKAGQELSSKRLKEGFPHVKTSNMGRRKSRK